MNIFLRKNIIVIILVSVLFLLLNLERNFNMSSDEGYYFGYTKIVAQNGFRSINQIIDWYARGQNAQFHPAPARIGYLVCSSLLFKLFGEHIFLLGLLSMISFILFIIVTFYFARKHYNLDLALILTFLLSSSPLLMGLSRRALIESQANLMVGLTVWLFLDFLIQKRRLNYILFIICFSWAILVKESTVLLWLFFFIFLLIDTYFFKQSLRWPYVVGIILWPTLITGTAYLLTLGDAHHLIILIQSIFMTHLGPENTNYTIATQSGPWYRLLLDFFVLSPIVMILFFGYIIHTSITKRWDRKSVYFLTYFVVIYVLVGMHPFRKNIRFVVNLEMVICLLASFVILEFLQVKKQNVQKLLALLSLWLMNFYNFSQIFYFPGVVDPNIIYLLMFKNIIPWSYKVF